MPTSLVKTPRDERLWQKAKDRAEEEGKGENYAYIMGIYKRMNPDRFDKSASFTTTDPQTHMAMISRVASRHLRAYNPGSRSDTGYMPGNVHQEAPYRGVGSQTPTPRDRNGKPVAVPEYGMMEIPGYEWHDKSQKFHSGT